MTIYFMEWMDISDREGNLYSCYIYRNGKNQVVKIAKAGSYIYEVA